MSENQSLSSPSDSPLANSPENTNSAQANDWEVAAIPGTVDSVQLAAEPTASGREGELLSLIHDLNQCNDVLLSRVTQLEGALEQSQSALENEMASAQAASGKMAQQVSVEQASAQQISYNAQQQIAKLVSQLDNTEQALSRQMLINENLQTEADNSKERISQLERECTLAAQQNLAEVQGRAKAEADSRDLRSRLQRQQRYTMQFKAALEKSLTVTARPSAAVAQPIAFKEAAVVMPKAQRIMPWVSDNSSPFAGIDPHLESLIRRVGKSNAGAEASDALVEPLHGSIAQKETVSENVSETVSENVSENAQHSEAEAKLWQDLERVISHNQRGDGADVIDQAAGITSDTRLDDPIDETPIVIDPIDCTPVITNEQSEVTATIKATSPEKVTSPKETSETNDLIHQIESSFAAANRNAPEEEVRFTEPSPWGKPLPEKQPAQKLEKIVNSAKAQPVGGSAEDSYLSAVDSQAEAALAPVVKALRSPKKSGTLANVELPTFHNAKVASFRR